MRSDPGIECRLRFLNQDHARQPGGSSGSNGQFPSDLIERRRDCQHHFLLRQGIRRIGSIPRILQMIQISRAGVNR